MSVSEGSDDLPSSQGSTQHNLILGLDMPQQLSHSSTVRLPTWSFPSAPASRTSLSPRRPETSRSLVGPSPELDLATTGPSMHHPALFSTPNRSIFSSGPPTSSVSANTAHASMSAPPQGNSSIPLSALTSPSFSMSRKHVPLSAEESNPPSKPRLSQAEKDIDDPSTPVERTSVSFTRGTTTPTALTRLFTAPEVASPTVSRHASYVRTSSGTTYTRGTIAQVW